MSERKRIDIWYCGGCNEVHVAAGGMRMSFNRDEYAVFTEMVVETHYTAWLHLKTNLVHHDSTDTVN